MILLDGQVRGVSGADAVAQFGQLMFDPWDPGRIHTYAVGRRVVDLLDPDYDVPPADVVEVIGECADSVEDLLRIPIAFERDAVALDDCTTY